MGGVEGDETHALEHAGFDLGDDGILDVAVGHVTPPDEDIGVGEDGVGETVFGLVEPGGAHGEVGVRAKETGDGFVHALRVEGGDLGVLFLVAEFAPDGDAVGWVHTSFMM